jgi:hypothetical protein
VPGALIGTGIALIVLAFLLAFTIFGEIAALAGVVLVATGARTIGYPARAESKGPTN